MRLSLFYLVLLLVPQLANAASAETIVARKVDPLTDKTSVFLGTNAAETSGTGEDDGLLYLVCESDNVGIRISTGMQFHPDVVINAAYRFGKKPAVPKTTWLWSYKTQFATTSNPLSVPFIKELISEREFYIQFETNEYARFDLTDASAQLSDFMHQCGVLNASFKNDFSGISVSIMP